MKPRKKTPPPAPARRRRLSSEDAREAILAATEKRLREVGPDALRLQEIASDVGISHPTVLHHVGSREELVAAVVARSMLALETDLLACLLGSLGPAEMVSTLHQIDEVMRIRGQARLVAWLALTQAGGGVNRDSRLGDVAAAVHGARQTLGSEGTVEDSSFGVVLVSTAMFGLALIGPRLFEMLGLPDNEATERRFREWFGALLLEHADIPVASGPSSGRR